MIVALGEALIDLIQREDGLFEPRPGGGPANTAIAIARLGFDVEFAGRISCDAFGGVIRHRLESNGVGLGLVALASQPTTLAIASLAADGSAAYSFYVEGTADWQWTGLELSLIEQAHPTAIHFGSLSAAIEPGASAIEALLRRLSRDVLVSYDINVRPGLGSRVAAERERVERQVRLSGLIKASDDDLTWLYPDEKPEQVAARWARTGRYVVLTFGSAGAAVVLPQGEVLTIPAMPVELVDTIGAGDAFCGGLLVALGEAGFLHGSTRGLAALTIDDWTTALNTAASVAALTCGRRGAEPPTSSELASSKLH